LSGSALRAAWTDSSYKTRVRDFVTNSEEDGEKEKTNLEFIFLKFCSA
jgi:hypothetical protein